MSTPTELLKKQLQIQLMNTDLFARQKVTLANPQFTYQNEYNKGDFQWVEKLTGTGTATHDPLDATVALNVLVTGDKVVRQSRKYMRYFSGKTLSLLATFFTDEMPAGVRFRVGYFDDNNGAFFERVDGVNYCVLRSSGVDQRVAQASWNKNQFTDYDFDKSTIFNINLQWLGVGNVQFIFEDTDGALIPVHVFENVGMTESTYMRTANLPVRYELESISNDASYTAKQICSAVSFEDGSCSQVSAYEHSASNGITPVAVTTRRCVLAVRPKLEFNSIENRADAIINAVELIAATNPSYWELVYNPTFGGTPTWNSVNDNSTLEFSVNATTITGGITVKSGFIASGSGNTRNTIGSQINSNYPLALDVDGANPTSYALVCTSFTGTSNINAAIDLREIY